jgi:hypothetical protein
MYKKTHPHKLSDGALVYSSEDQADQILQLDGKTIKTPLIVYLEEVRRKIPQGWVLQHNHIAPRLLLGRNGIRTWLANKGEAIRQCEAVISESI